MNLRTDDILARLNRPPADGREPPSAHDLLARYDQPEYAPEWDADPRLYRWFVRRFIDQGYPTPALKLARRRLDKDGGKGSAARVAAGDPVLRYLAALAFARGGNPESAARYAGPLLDQILADGWAAPPGVDPAPFRGEVVALRGRLFKDLARKAPAGEVRASLARQSADWYEKAAAEVAANAYQLGNAAAMRYVQGDRAAAARLAEAAHAQAMREAEADPDGYWSPATAGEAGLILGRDAEAHALYERAVAGMLKARALGALSAVLPNLELLAEAGLGFDPAAIRSRIGGVVVFSGHRIDPPWYSAAGLPPRFPDDTVLVNAVKDKIAAELNSLNARFGFCSLACGSDVLFAEAMLERRANLQVVLPFAETDFLRLSVNYGRTDPGWAAWAGRYQGVLGQLSRFRDAVYFATDEPYLGSDRLFGYANEVLQGVGVVRARQLGVAPTALVVLDPGSPVVPGGAGHFRGLWAKAGRPARVIDLAVLREEVGPVARPPEPAPPADPPPALPRPVRAMLFADVAGFSRMKEEAACKFFELFPRIVADTLGRVGGKVLVKNTWGDGIFAAFGADADHAAGGEAAAAGVTAAATVALQLVAAFDRATADWQGMGFADPNPLRVALHAGPVFELSHDPVLGRMNVFGQHVNRTARIEPITLPGAVYASEQFAALLTVADPAGFECEFVGVEPLAKEYATAPLYRVWRSLVQIR